MTDAPHHLKLMRSDDGRGVYMNSNNRCLYFDNAMWEELESMIATLRRTGERVVMNYAEQLPVRTPLHANTPVERPKASLEDLA